ncbi:MAG: ATP synthase F0 subunit C [Ignavibacteria bacterium]|jgi:F-type H+-transporting ATPase subunit c|nr:MAG: ATP synthase F0 subunit C [Ignavibacteria bacterium]
MELAWLAAGIGAAIVVVGAGLGIGKLAAAALEAIGRQPEAAGDLRGAMIIMAALIEGIALFAVVVCLLLALK